MRIARIVVEPETSSELRNQWGNAVWLMTTLKLSSVGCCGRKSRLLRISVCDLKALLIAQASGAMAKAESRRSNAWVTTLMPTLSQWMRRCAVRTRLVAARVRIVSAVSMRGGFATTALLVIDRHPALLAGEDRWRPAPASAPWR